MITKRIFPAKRSESSVTLMDLRLLRTSSVSINLGVQVFSVLIAILLSIAADNSVPDQNELSIQNARFVVRGQKQFLLGISYFDGLSAPPDIQLADFTELRNKGFNAIRVWGTWYREEQPRLVPLFRRSGSINPEGLLRLRRLLSNAQAKGLVTVLTFSRHTLIPISFENYKRGILAVISSIKPFRSVLIDIQNEVNHCRTIDDPTCEGHLSLQQVGNIRTAIRLADPRRLSTASRNGQAIIAGKDDYGSFRTIARVDYISTHRPPRSRDAVWAQTTDDEVRQIRAIVGRTVPILLDESNRCNANVPCTNPSAATRIFYMAARNAKIAGAAGWFFHTKAGFKLSHRSIFAQLNSTERQVVLNLGRILRPIP